MARIMSVFGQSGRGAAASEDSTSADAVTTPPAAAKQSAPLALMTLGKTLVFKGELCADEDMVLFGRVEGSIAHTGSVTIALGGVVIGNVRARSVTIRGNVEGDIEASESVTVAPNAVVNGDIVAPRVSIVDGAKFNGCVDMPQRAAAESKKPSADPASPAPMLPSATPLSDGEAAQVLGER